MQQNLRFETRLDLEATTSDKLKNLVNKTAAANNLILPAALQSHELIWKSEFFHLDRSVLFLQSSEDEKFRILKNLNQALLSEIYFIERCGMFYAAKMGLLSETVEERALYGMMGADESLHYLWVSSLTGALDPKSYETQPFLKFLNQILELEDKNILIAIVQILLEGWGLRHYKRLSEFSHQPLATQAFQQILKDEASHHGGGLILFDAKKQTALNDRRLKEVLQVFFSMVRCGPQMVISALQTELGHLTLGQKQKVFEELKATEESQRNLDFLRSLLVTAKLPGSMLESLEQEKFFSSLSSQECAEV